MKPTKCEKCKREIRFIKDDFIFWNEKYWHHVCLQLLATEKPKKISLDRVEELFKETRVSHRDEPVKHKLYLFLQQQYDIVILTDALIEKLNSIFSGTYKDMVEPVSPADLLEMWELQMDNLNKISYYNDNKGKIMEGGFKLSYHLAIVLSKFKNYKSWQTQVEHDKKEIEEQNRKPKIDFSKLRDNKKEDGSDKKENGDLDWLIDF